MLHRNISNRLPRQYLTIVSKHAIDVSFRCYRSRNCSIFTQHCTISFTIRINTSCCILYNMPYLYRSQNDCNQMKTMRRWNNTIYKLTNLPLPTYILTNCLICKPLVHCCFNWHCKWNNCLRATSVHVTNKMIGTSWDTVCILILFVMEFYYYNLCVWKRFVIYELVIID